MTSDPDAKFHVLLFLIPFYLIGLIYGKFILSLAMISIILASLIYIYRGGSQSMESAIERFLRSPAWWIITGYFFVVLFGGWYSEDTASWLVRLRVKLPFLILPFCFYVLPDISKKDYYRFVFLFVIITFLSTIPILFSVIMNFQAFLNDLSRGLAVGTPVNHIRYSLLVAMACFGALILYNRRFQVISKKEIPIYLAIGIYFLLFLHLIAVRSGIFCFYLTGIVWAIKFLLNKRTRIRGLVLLVILGSLPFMMISTLPSVSKRWEYMVDDFRKFKSGQWDEYSDSERILSVQAGLNIIKDHPWWGVGPGDMNNVCRERFLTLFDKTTFLLPHNQFVFVAAGSGLLGLGVFIVSFFLPLFRFIRSPEPFWFSALTIVFFSFFVENTLETAVGTGLFILPLLMGIRYQYGRRETVDGQRQTVDG